MLGTDGSKAFAVFGVVGTANNINIRDFLERELRTEPRSPPPDRPHGATRSTRGRSVRPNAPYTLEGKAFAEYLKKNKPNATVAMLVQNDDFGAAYEEGFKKAIEGTNIKVVKVEKYAAGANEVGAQMTSLAATNADAFFDGATLLACPDALKKAQAANWKPIIWVSGTCISKTLMGIAGDAAQGSDQCVPTSWTRSTRSSPTTPAMKLYSEKVKKYEPDADIDNGIVAYGWTQGALLVKAMEAAKAPTRLDVMNSVRQHGRGQRRAALDGRRDHDDGDEGPVHG